MTAHAQFSDQLAWPGFHPGGKLSIYHYLPGTHRCTGYHHPKWWHWIICKCIQRTRSSDISLTSAVLKLSDCTLTTNNSTTIMYHRSHSIIIMCCLRLPLVIVRGQEDGWELIPPLLFIQSERSSQELWECLISLDVILIHVSSSLIVCMSFVRTVQRLFVHVKQCCPCSRTLHTTCSHTTSHGHRQMRSIEDCSRK